MPSASSPPTCAPCSASRRWPGRPCWALDPGFRTGCKVAVVDPTGKLLDTGTIYPHEPQKQWDEALETLAALVAAARRHPDHDRQRHRLARDRAAGGRADPQRDAPQSQYLIVNEAGASVYSASPLARAELPDLDVTLRGAVSIARRVQDPLAELVKIDPKSIGVGMYQHDVDQKQLAAVAGRRGGERGQPGGRGCQHRLAGAADLCRRDRPQAGREDRGLPRRERAFPQPRRRCARCPGWGRRPSSRRPASCASATGDNPLDASAIHPESYRGGRSGAEAGRADAATHRPPSASRRWKRCWQAQPLEKLAAELGAGVPTLEDILEQLVRPGRDPRQDLPAPILRSDVLSMEDLAAGMRLKGTVRNVVDFGAFVDIGVKQDGLLHRSQILPRRAASGRRRHRCGDPATSRTSAAASAWAGPGKRHNPLGAIEEEAMNMKEPSWLQCESSSINGKACWQGWRKKRITAGELPDGWSVKDLVAHLMAWRQRSIARIEAAMEEARAGLSALECGIRQPG